MRTTSEPVWQRRHSCRAVLRGCTAQGCWAQLVGHRSFCLECLGSRDALRVQETSRLGSRRV